MNESLNYTNLISSKFETTLYIKLICFYTFFGLISCSKVVKNQGDLVYNDDASLFLSGDGTKTIDNKIYNLQGKALQVTGTLSFKNEGKIINGTLIGKGVKIITSGNTPIFENISVKGKWDVPEGYLYWFYDGSDPVQNFKALCSLVEMESVCILDKMYAIGTSTSNEHYRTTKSIRIRGIKRKECGLVLKTKHSHSNAYFRGITGNNIYLENMTLVTEDYKNKIAPKGYDYYFAWAYYSSADRESKPDFQYFKIDSCDILGAISFRYSSSAQNTTPSEMLQTGIDTILVLNSKIEDCVSLIELSNGRYDISRIENNEIKNIYGPVFYFPLGDLVSPYSPTDLSALRKSFRFIGNHIYNEKLISSIGEGYMSSFVVKGAEITVENNIFENLLNDNDNIETVPFYTSALIRTDILNNKVTNCIGRGYTKEIAGSNCFLRLRGSKNVYVRDNKFELNNKALFSLGLLKSEKSNIEEIDKTKFRFCLWSGNLNDSDFEAEYVFENNVFSTSLLNEHSIMSRSKIHFSNNRININFLADMDENNWINSQSIYNGCLILFRDKTIKGNLLFKENIISVDKSDSPVLWFTKDVNDNKSFDIINYQNNKFSFNGDVSLAFPRSKSIEGNNRLFGEGSIIYNETTSNNIERTIGNLNVTSIIRNYKAATNSLIHPKFGGSITLIAENNADTIINVMNIRFQDVYANSDLKNGPILIDIEASYTLKNNTKVNENYQLVIGDYSNLYFINKADKIDQTFPFWTIRMPKYRYSTSQSDGRISKFPLVITSTIKGESIDNNSYLVVTNTGEIASFKIQVSIAENKLRQRSSSRLLDYAKSKR